MIGSISGTGSYFVMYRYHFTGGVSDSAKQADAAQGPGASIQQGQTSFESPWLGGGSSRSKNPAVIMHTGGFGEDSVPDRYLRKGADPAEYAVRMRMQYLDQEGSDLSKEAAGVEGTSGVYGEEQCQTCEQRRYQDGSDDMGVSFQTPTKIAPEAAGAAVRGHEQEHVTRERAKAQREDREVVSQSVTLHTDICPECGKVYISGGTTQTTTASRPEPDMGERQNGAESPSFSAVA